jgi:hypothetical protein
VRQARRGEIRKGRHALALRAFELRDAGVATAAIARTIGVARRLSGPGFVGMLV